MCLRTYDPTPQVAQNNIPCYKYGKFFGTTFSPEFKPFKYFRHKKTPEVLLEPQINYHAAWYDVERGYHSFNKLNDCSLSTLGDTDKIALFIIPKRTKYIEGTWEGGCANRVASRIIYLGKNTKFNRLIGKIFYGVSFDK